MWHLDCGKTIPVTHGRFDPRQNISLSRFRLPFVADNDLSHQGKMGSHILKYWITNNSNDILLLTCFTIVQVTSESREICRWWCGQAHITDLAGVMSPSLQVSCCEYEAFCLASHRSLLGLALSQKFALVFVNHSLIYLRWSLWPLLQTWFNFNPRMDK